MSNLSKRAKSIKNQLESNGYVPSNQVSSLKKRAQGITDYLVSQGYTPTESVPVSSVSKKSDTEKKKTDTIDKSGTTKAFEGARNHISELVNNATKAKSENNVKNSNTPIKTDTVPQNEPHFSSGDKATVVKKPSKIGMYYNDAITGLNGAWYRLLQTADFVNSKSPKTMLTKLADDKVGDNKYLKTALNIVSNINNPQDKVIKTLKSVYERETKAGQQRSAEAHYMTPGHMDDDIGETVSSLAGMLPQTIVALLSGGASEGATVADYGTKAVSDIIQQGIIENPSFWYSFSMTAGPEYEKAKEKGATEAQATTAAWEIGVINALIEIGGGLEAPNASKKGLWNHIKENGLGEAKEEVLQGGTENLIEKIVYAPSKPWFSTTDEDAVINPNRAFKEGKGGLIGGLFWGSAMKGINSGVNLYNNTAYNSQTSKAVKAYANTVQSTIDKANTAIIEVAKQSDVKSFNLPTAPNWKKTTVAAINNYINETVKKYNELLNDEKVTGENKETIRQTLKDMGVDGEIEVKAESVSDNDLLNEEVQKRFADNVDKVFRGELPRERVIEIGHTPRLLQEYGAGDLPMSITQNTMYKIAYPTGYFGAEDGGHNLGIPALKQLPSQIAEPTAILKSNSQSDSLVLLTEWKDAKGNPVIVPLHLDKNGILGMTNEVASAYGKKDMTPLLIDSNGDSTVLYTKNNEDIHQLLQAGLQLPSVVADDTLVNNSISQNEQNVNNEVNTNIGNTWQASQLTPSIARYMNGLTGAPSDMSGIETANNTVRSGEYNVFDRDFVNGYADGFVQGMAERNSNAYRNLSQSTDNLSGELASYVLTGQSSLANNNFFRIAAQNFENVLTDAVNKNAIVHSTSYGNDTRLAQQAEAVRNGDFSVMNVGELQNADTYSDADPIRGLIQDEFSDILAESERNAIDSLATAIGRTVKIVPTIGNGKADGCRIGDVLYIAANANDKFTYVFAHELTHSLEGTNGYANYSDAILDRLAREENVSVDELVSRKIAEYAEGGITLDDTGARQELVADFTKNILTDENKAMEFVNSIENAQQRRTVIQWLRDSIRNLINRIRGNFNADVARLNDLERISNMFEGMLQEAANETTNENTSNAVQFDFKVDNDIYMPYNEYRQLQDYIIQKNNRDTELMPTDCTEIGEHFYVWINYNKEDNHVTDMIEIIGNEDFIDEIREAVYNGTYEGSEALDRLLQEYRDERNINSGSDGRTERTGAYRENDRLLGGQEAEDGSGNFRGNGTNTAFEKSDKQVSNNQKSDVDNASDFLVEEKPQFLFAGKNAKTVNVGTLAQAKGMKAEDMTAEERQVNFPESMKPRDDVVFADRGIQFSMNKSFSEQVHDVLEGKSMGNNHVYVGETTSILRQLGLNDKPMLMTVGHVKDINHAKDNNNSKYHGLSEKTINKLPHILDYPAIVFDSFSDKNPNAICILSDETDDDGYPILVVIKPDGQGRYNDVWVDSNFILSMYGKDDNPQGFIDEIGKHAGNVLFADKKRTQRMLSVKGLQLPKSLSNLKFNTIIHKTNNVVNTKNDGKSAKNNQSINAKEQFSLKKPVVKDSDTYDDDGNIIPLSKRFDPNNADIRFATRDNSDTANNANAAASALMKKYNANGRGLYVKDVRDAIYALAGEIHDISYSEETFPKIEAHAQGITRMILDNARVVDESAKEEYNHVRDFMKGKKIKITDELKSSIPDWNDFRKSTMGTLVLANNGTPVDVIYKELAEEFPQHFDEQEYVTQSDQLYHIFDTMRSLKPQESTLSETEYDAALEELTGDILSRVINMAENYKPRKVKEASQYEDADWNDLAHSDIAWQEWDKQRQEKDRDRQRYNKKIQQIQEKANDRVEQEKEHYRQRYNKKLQQIQEKANQRIKRAAEIRKESEDRTKLLNISRRLNNMKLSPENKARIPDIVYEIDTVSKGILKEGYTTVDGREIMGELDLRKLRDDYLKIKETDPDFIPNKDIESRIVRLDKRQIADMDIADVRELVRTLQEVEHEIRTHNKMLRDAQQREIAQVANDSVHEIKRAKGVKDSNKGSAVDKFWSTQLSPLRMARRIVGYAKNSSFEGLFKDLNDGQLKSTTFKQKASRRFNALVADAENMQKFTGKNAELIDISAYDTEGRKVYITPAMRTALYLHSKNYANLRHIKYGGITVPNMEMFNKGRITDAYKSNGMIIKLTPSQVRSITNGMTEFEKRFADVAYQFFNEDCKTAVNETSLVLNGYEKARVKNYFPIVSNKNFVNMEFESLKRDGTYEGLGILSERQYSGNPIVLEDVVKVISRHMNDVADYSGLAVPIRNFNKVYNAMGSKYAYSTKQAINAKWGSNATNYIENLMTDLQGGRTEKGMALLKKLNSNYAQATLSLNVGVTLQQAGSYPTAAAELGWKPLMQAFSEKVTDDDKKIIAKYTPLLWLRSQGYTTSELGDYTSGASDDWTKRGKMPWLMGWIQKSDMMTTTKLWKASEFYVRDNFSDLEKGSDDYYKKVAEVYNNVIESTQPNYTPMQRADLLRNPNAVVKATSMFRTQPSQNHNLVYDAFGEYKARKADYEANQSEENKAEMQAAERRLRQTLISQVVAAMVVNLFKGVGLYTKGQLFKHYGGKDEDDEGKLTPQGVIIQFLQDSISTMAGNVWFGSDAVGMLFKTLHQHGIGRGAAVFDTEAPALSMYNDIVNDITSIDKMVADGKTNPWNITKKLNKVIVHLGTAFGVPVKNTENLIKGIYKDITDATKTNNFFDLLDAWSEGGNRTYTKSDKSKYKANMTLEEYMDYQAYYEKTLQDMLSGKIRKKDGGMYSESGAKTQARNVTNKKFEYLFKKKVE